MSIAEPRTTQTPVVGPISRPELLAPAGDLTCLNAAVENGADAVYFGLQGHNARVRAHNFDLDSLPDIMATLHARGVKAYVTLNTLVFPAELNSLETIVRRVAEAGVDAIIVQDLGLCRLIRAITPDLPLHASTQMSITSVEGIRLARDLGCSRVILARELSLSEIARITRESPLPVEVFVHGALCVAYSGQCLTSEALGGRSANRGECAQACRMPYQIVCDGQDVNLGDVQYLLSPQDLAAFDLMPELIAHGVSSFKIEGRLKAPEYVASITRHYRDAIDLACLGQPVEFDRATVDEMAMTFSRGFSHGFLDGNNHKVLVRGDYAKKRGIYLGTVTRVAGGRVQLELNAPIKPGDGVVFDGKDETNVPEQGGRVYEVWTPARARQPARRDPAGLSAGPAELAFGRHDFDLTQLRPGQRVWKTDDPELTRRVRASFEGPPRRLVDLDVTAHAVVGEPLALDARTATGLTARVTTEAPLGPADRHPASLETLREQFDRLGGTIYRLGAFAVELDGGPLVPRSVLNSLRRELIARLDDRAALLPTRMLASNPVVPVLKAAIGAAESLGSQVPASPSPCPLPPGERVKTESPSAVALPSAEGASNEVSRSDFRPLPSVGEGWGEGAREAPHEDMTRQGAGARAPASGSNSPALSALCHNLPQAEVALRAGVRTIYLDFQHIKEYADAVATLKKAEPDAAVFLATPRVLKPGEAPLLRLLAKANADGLLIRNADGLAFCTKNSLPFVADFSWNAANELTVEFLKARGALRVTASYDLSFDQLDDLLAAVPPAWVEIVVHQHMPMFLMEFCTFSAHLSNGQPSPHCGRPCDQHTVKLRDRVGVEHPLKADVACKNTLYNAIPQTAAEYLPRFISRGVKNLRVEFLENDPASVTRILGLYQDAIAGRRDAKNLWRELKATNQYGVTRGQLAVLG